MMAMIPTLPRSPFQVRRWKSFQKVWMQFAFCIILFFLLHDIPPANAAARLTDTRKKLLQITVSIPESISTASSSFVRSFPRQHASKNLFEVHQDAAHGNITYYDFGEYFYGYSGPIGIPFALLLALLVGLCIFTFARVVFNSCGKALPTQFYSPVTVFTMILSMILLFCLLVILFIASLSSNNAVSAALDNSITKSDNSITYLDTVRLPINTIYQSTSTAITALANLGSSLSYFQGLPLAAVPSSNTSFPSIVSSIQALQTNNKELLDSVYWLSNFSLRSTSTVSFTTADALLSAAAAASSRALYSNTDLNGAQQAFSTLASSLSSSTYLSDTSTTNTYFASMNQLLKNNSRTLQPTLTYNNRSTDPILAQLESIQTSLDSLQNLNFLTELDPLFNFNFLEFQSNLTLLVNDLSNSDNVDIFNSAGFNNLQQFQALLSSYSPGFWTEFQQLSQQLAYDLLMISVSSTNAIEAFIEQHNFILQFPALLNNFATLRGNIFPLSLSTFSTNYNSFLTGISSVGATAQSSQNTYDALVDYFSPPYFDAIIHLSSANVSYLTANYTQTSDFLSYLNNLNATLLTLPPNISSFIVAQSRSLGNWELMKANTTMPMLGSVALSLNTVNSQFASIRSVMASFTNFTSLFTKSMRYFNNYSNVFDQFANLHTSLSTVNTEIASINPSELQTARTAYVNFLAYLNSQQSSITAGYGQVLEMKIRVDAFHYSTDALIAALRLNQDKLASNSSKAALISELSTYISTIADISTILADGHSVLGTLITVAGNINDTIPFANQPSPSVSQFLSNLYPTFNQIVLVSNNLSDTTNFNHFANFPSMFNSASAALNTFSALSSSTSVTISNSLRTQFQTFHDQFYSLVSPSSDFSRILFVRFLTTPRSSYDVSLSTDDYQQVQNYLAFLSDLQQRLSVISAASSLEDFSAGVQELSPELSTVVEGFDDVSAHYWTQRQKIVKTKNSLDGLRLLFFVVLSFLPIVAFLICFFVTLWKKTGTMMLLMAYMFLTLAATFLFLMTFEIIPTVFFVDTCQDFNGFIENLYISGTEFYNGNENGFFFFASPPAEVTGEDPFVPQANKLFENLQSAYNVPNGIHLKLSSYIQSLMNSNCSQIINDPNFVISQLANEEAYPNYLNSSYIPAYYQRIVSDFHSLNDVNGEFPASLATSMSLSLQLLSDMPQTVFGSSSSLSSMLACDDLTALYSAWQDSFCSPEAGFTGLSHALAIHFTVCFILAFVLTAGGVCAILGFKRFDSHYFDPYKGRQFGRYVQMSRYTLFHLGYLHKDEYEDDQRYPNNGLEQHLLNPDDADNDLYILRAPEEDLIPESPLEDIGLEVDDEKEMKEDGPEEIEYEKEDEMEEEKEANYNHDSKMQDEIKYEKDEPDDVKDGHVSNNSIQKDHRSKSRDELEVVDVEGGHGSGNQDGPDMESDKIGNEPRLSQVNHENHLSRAKISRGKRRSIGNKPSFQSP